MPDFEISDEVLIAKFQQGDERAYNQIVLRYRDKLLNFVYRFVYDADKAEDLVQDTFVKLYTHKHYYKEIAKFSTWLYTIAGNLARTEIRKKNRRQTYNASELQYDDQEFDFFSEDDTDTETDSKNIGKSIQSALLNIPENFKTMVILRDIQELSYEDISSILDVPLGTVKSRINRGRLKIQDYIKKKGVA